MKNKKQSEVFLSYKFMSKADEEAGIVTGIGSKYGNVDRAGDVIMPNAFKKSIQEKIGNGYFPILWQHKLDEPIGIIKEIYEDKEGLKIKAQINLDTQRGREAHSLAKQEALGGFSVGFFIEKYKVNDTKGLDITEGSLLEVSLVTFPCNTQAIIESVKSDFENGKNSQTLVLAANKLHETVKKLHTTKVNKTEHLELLQEILALITSNLGDANAEVDEEMFDDSDSDKELPVSDEAATTDGSQNGTSTEEEPDEEVEKMLHSILANFKK